MLWSRLHFLVLPGYVPCKPGSPPDCIHLSNSGSTGFPGLNIIILIINQSGIKHTCKLQRLELPQLESTQSKPLNIQFQLTFNPKHNNYSIFPFDFFSNFPFNSSQTIARLKYWISFFFAMQMISSENITVLEYSTRPLNKLATFFPIDGATSAY